MSWVLTDDHASEDEQLCDAGGLAAWYHTCAHGFCRRKEHIRAPLRAALDFVPETNALGLFAPYTLAQARSCVAALLRVGLWRRVEGGYQLVDYQKRYGHDSGRPAPALPTSSTTAEGELTPAQLGGRARAEQASRGPAGKFQPRPAGDQPAGASRTSQLEPAGPASWSQPAGPAEPASRASDPEPDPEPDQESREIPTTQGPVRLVRAGEPDLVVVAGGQLDKIQCPADLKLTDAQRATLVTALVPAWAIGQLELRFRANYTADPSDQRTLTVWLKCLSSYVARCWNDPRQRPTKPDAPEGERDAQARLRKGPRQPNTHTHLDDTALAAATGATLE